MATMHLSIARRLSMVFLLSALLTLLKGVASWPTSIRRR